MKRFPKRIPKRFYQRSVNGMWLSLPLKGKKIMFASNNLQHLSLNRTSLTERLQRQATSLFTVELRRARWGKFVAKLKGNAYRILDLKALRPNLMEASMSYIGLQTVPLDSIRGSEGRTRDFDNNMRPLSERTRERWQNVAKIMLRGDSLPPVELIKVGDIYFVRDGHHRISVARALVQQYIDANITRV
jgi:hypothetical protein